MMNGSFKKRGRSPRLTWMPTGHIQILGGGTADGGSSLLVFFDEHRYLINCGEGTQRFCCHHHVRLSRLSAIFLPRLEWDCSGGLPGMICTVADAGGISGLTLVGPKNTAHFIGTLRPFLRRTNFNLTLLEAADDLVTPVFADELIGVFSFELFGGKKKCNPTFAADVAEEENKRRKTPLGDDLELAQLENISFVKQMFKQSIERNSGENTHLREPSRMPSTSFHGASLCYIFQGPETLGKFDAAKAKALGVPVGPLNGRLAKGETLSIIVDGEECIVRPEDVVSPSSPGVWFCVLTVPSLTFAEDLERKLARLEGLPRLVLIFHCCPEAVFFDKFYQANIVKPLSVNAQVKQIWLGGGKHLPLVYPGPAKILADLNINVSDSIFPLPYITGPSTHTSPPLLKYFWTTGCLTDEAEAKLLLSETLAIQNSTGLRSPYRTPTADNPVITFLGTGAAMPGKYRNVSSTLVDFGDSAYLLDCGEATYGQLVRRFTPEELASIMQRLKAVLISHLHADHQLGLPTFLQAQGGERLAIVAPKRYQLFLEELQECVQLEGAFDLYDSETMEVDQEYSHTVASAIGMKRLSAIPAIHCPHSYGFVLTHPAGIKISFSGDTRPCPALAEAGRGSDILIHEASFCDALQAEAVEKRHSTLSEAIGIGKSMEAHFTLLNHISQRYAKTLPPYDWTITRNVLPVIDFMSVSLSQLEGLDLVDLIEKMIEHLPNADDEE